MTMPNTPATSQGVAGAPGAPGANGSNGSNGSTGSTGSTGSNGSNGAQGAHGAHHAHGGAQGQQAALLRPPVDRDSIPGWGADLDRKMRPGVPMERMPPRMTDMPDTPLAQQPETVEVLHSIERPTITPIFGTSSPPSGVSGMIRRAAYKTSENDLRHWLLLLLADRVNVVEGLGQDLARGKIPNVFSEMGIATEWRYNKVGLARKAAVGAALVGIGWYLMQRRRER
jgi:Collagen triple helix repeat (20 copies)